MCLGKTLLAKAVANQTSATFLRVVGSELIQKYLVSLVINCHWQRICTLSRTYENISLVLFAIIKLLNIESWYLQCIRACVHDYLTLGNYF